MTAVSTPPLSAEPMRPPPRAQESADRVVPPQAHSVQRDPHRGRAVRPRDDRGTLSSRYSRLRRHAPLRVRVRSVQEHLCRRETSSTRAACSTTPSGSVAAARCRRRSRRIRTAIFLMGGSTAYGTGGLWPHLQRDFAVLKNSETIDAYLERILGEALPGKDRGHQRRDHQHVDAPSSHLPESDHSGLRPGHGAVPRRLQRLLPRQPGPRPVRQLSLHDASIGNPRRADTGALARANGWWFYRRSALAHVTMRSLRTLKLVVTAPFAERDRAPMNVDRAMANLEHVFPRSALAMQRRMALILRDAGVVPVFMLQPMLILERGHKPMQEMEQRLFAFNVESYLPNYEQFIRRAVAMASRAGDGDGLRAGRAVHRPHRHLRRRRRADLHRLRAPHASRQRASRASRGRAAGARHSAGCAARLCSAGDKARAERRVVADRIARRRGSAGTAPRTPVAARGPRASFASPKTRSTSGRCSSIAMRR